MTKTAPDQVLRLGLYLRESKSIGDKQVEDQRKAGTRWSDRNGCVIPDGRVYIDNDLSASVYAKKARKEFERLARDIEAERLDLVWFWSLSRSQRRLDQYVTLRNLCQLHGVNWVVDERVFDLTDPMDLRSLGMAAVDDEVFSRQLSKNVRRGIAENAALGKPHGHTYGFRRIYNDKREYVKQVPDDALRESNTGFWWSPAGVISEIIRRIAKGTPITQLKADLEEREIPTPKGGKEWARTVIRDIARNKAYIGTRVHRPKDGPATEVPNAWAPIDPDPEFPNIFAKAQAVLSDPKRKTTKPARGRHLLSYIAYGACGLPLQTDPPVKGRRRRYRCEDRCASILADDLDIFVRAVIDGYLAREDVQAFLAAGQGDNGEAVAARGEVAKLREELEDWRKLADAGEVTPLDYARFSKALRGRIEDAEQWAEDASISPVIPREVDWSDLAIARQVIAALAEIRLKPIGKGGQRLAHASKRVTWRWIIGPDADRH